MIKCGRKSLNPCFNGRYSQSGMTMCEGFPLWVLILVLMEDTLRAINGLYEVHDVLILVLMEDTLRGVCVRGYQYNLKS